MKTIELINELGLQKHPEGGYYKETYRSKNKLGNNRSVSTAIYFLLENGNFSAFHKIKSDELWHFYSGDCLEVIEIKDNGTVIRTLIGNNIDAGEQFQYCVKANTWFASRVKSGGAYSLVGCTVAPGFDFRDFELAKRIELVKQFPQHKNLIYELTRG